MVRFQSKTNTTSEPNNLHLEMANVSFPKLRQLQISWISNRRHFLSPSKQSNEILAKVASKLEQKRRTLTHNGCAQRVSHPKFFFSSRFAAADYRRTEIIQLRSFGCLEMKMKMEGEGEGGAKHENYRLCIVGATQCVLCAHCGCWRKTLFDASVTVRIVCFFVMRN